MKLPEEDMEKKLREDVNKVFNRFLGKETKSSNPELEELMIADYLLERAYAHDPLVMAWFDTHGYAIEELEAEVERLDRALAGKRVGAPIIDILKMREDIAEKERHLTPLLELELILEGAQRMQAWAYEKMKEKGFETIEKLEAEVEKLRGVVANPQKIVPLILKDHTETNIVKVADYVQTEGAITVVHADRRFVPLVSVTMGVEEPIELTSKLVTVPKYKDGYRWYVTWGKAFSLLKTIEPYLMADKWESARYLLNIGKPIPDTEYRPMYHSIVKGVEKVILLHPEYVDFPTKYSLVIRKGDELPKPFYRLLAMKYTPEGLPIRWHEGMVKE